MDRYPGLKEFYWAKEKIRKLYRQESWQEATKLLDNIIFNLRLSDDGELIRWGNALKRWREPILNHFGNDTTNGFTEGCDTKIKMLKQVSYGLRNLEVTGENALGPCTIRKLFPHNLTKSQILSCFIQYHRQLCLITIPA